MIYLVTGASGFIGRRLVRKLLSRSGSTAYFLMRDASPARCEALRAFWEVDKTRAIPVVGDLNKPGLGLSDSDREMLAGRVDHVFHLAAVYDLNADPEIEVATNVAGTRNAVELAQAIGAGHFHHMSSIAAAGLYPGVFREDMFEEATKLEHPYFASKHEAEKVVRSACKIPWRIYRPGIVVGDSRSGEMDKIDGPYYFFKPIQKIRGLLPPWMPTIGIEGGRINLVPVDFVVDALDHIAHLEGQDGRCFHLTDPHPRRFGDVLSIFARAAHAPAMTLRINAALFEMVPKGLAKGLSSLSPVRRIQRAVMKDLGLPEGIFTFVNYPTRFDCRDAEALLEPAGISVPPLEDYAWRLWDYWERHLDPDLFVERSLRGRVAGRVVLVTGGSSGVGKATALRIAEAGATTIIIARDPQKLEATQQEAAARGLELITYAADLTDAEQCAALAQTLVEAHGGVDILVNNAGRSIRRSIENSYDRMHDFERMMAINYFGAVRLTMALLPAMAKKRRGQVINISSIGVLTNAPRFSAYVASKSALEAWTRCAASEFVDRGIEFTTINLPLVRTPMTAPTEIYKHFPTLTPEEAAGFVVEAITRKPVRIATRLGIFGQVLHALAPHIAQIVNNTAFRMFPDSAAARGSKGEKEAPTADQVALTQLLRGVHF
ncbi:MAG: SDR family oxidoreductase [Kiloniellales bacterium]|nr:SDR family oxidoreductase [Kiloniellales bacterium]